MIYFDNAATTLMKPPEVAAAVAHAIGSFGNPGRSFHDPALVASREVYDARREVARLIGSFDPLQVAFTSSATEGLNLVIGGLVRKEDAVVTTVLEHNSVLRPLYLSGCDLGFLDCDASGRLLMDGFEKLLKPATRFLVCAHGSNVTGNIIDAHGLYGMCKAHGVTLILDIAQTFGSVPVDMGMADIFCFTGHKALFGPQGTGGVIVKGEHDIRPVKSGGAGAHSFDHFQSKDMPDVFEAGTLNSHGIYGLQKGVRFINELGVDAIHGKEARLLELFHEGIHGLEGVMPYGDFTARARLPILSLNLRGMAASELAERLWEGYGIATRAGSHCAPLLHERLGTADMGMVRFSFSYFNTEDEVLAAVAAIREISGALG
jgi:cysteine desulfurase family protein